MSKKFRPDGALPAAPIEPAPPAPPARSRAEIGAELVALQIAYSVSASPEALGLLRRTTDEYLETFR